MTRTTSRRTGRVAAATAAMLASLLGPAIADAQTPQRAPSDPSSVVVDDLSATAVSTCGQVALNTTLFLTPANVARLPVSVYVTEPSRGLGRTLVRTFTSAADLGVNVTGAPLFVADPSGRGPALQVEMSWAGGSTTFVSNPYYNNCQGSFFALRPVRMLDTRAAIGVGSTTRVAPGSVTVVDPASVAGVPPERVTALALNVTAADGLTGGYLTVYPCATALPSTSNVNFGAGQTIPNFVLADLVAHPGLGTICIFSSASVHVIADVTGYVLNDQDPLPTGGRYNSLPTPARLLDSRNGARLAAGETRAVRVLGAGGVPGVGVSAAVLNVTAVGAAGPGYLTAFPCGTEPPNASMVNYADAAPVPNAGIIGIGAGGEVCVFSSAQADVLVDVTGYFAPNGLNLIGSPGIRLTDTRSGAPMPANQTTRFRLGSGFTAQLVNVVIIEPSGPGYATIFPCDSSVPDTSNLNFSTGQTVANGAFVRLGADGTFCVRSTQEAHVIVDWAGFTTAPLRAPAV